MNIKKLNIDDELLRKIETHLRQNKTDINAKIEKITSTLLRSDIEAFFHYISTNKVIVKKKQMMLPTEHLRPLNKVLKKQSLHTYDTDRQSYFPYIDSLFLFLRQSGLLQRECIAGKYQFTVDFALWETWSKLNDIDFYLQCVYIYTFEIQPFLIDKLNRDQDRLSDATISVFRNYFKGNRKMLYDYIGRYPIQYYHFTLLEYLGWVTLKVSPPEAPKTRLNISKITVTRIGWAFYDWLIALTSLDLIYDKEGQEKQFYFFTSLLASDFQAKLPPQKNECVNVVLEFKLYLHDRGYRVFRASSSDTLEEFVYQLLRNVLDFDRDHLFTISYSDPRGIRRVYSHSRCRDLDYYEDFADTIKLGELCLEKSSVLDLYYDFGQSWEFKIELVDILPENTKFTPYEIIDKKGELPKQYDWDDDEDYD